VESPSRRRRRPLARNTRTIYWAKCFKCGWDCLFLNNSAPYASTHPLLYTLIAHPSSQPRSKRELDFKFVSGRPMKRLEVEFEAYVQSHSYDSPLVSQPSMSSLFSSSQLRPTLGLLTPSLDFSDVEPVACPWTPSARRWSEIGTVIDIPCAPCGRHTDGVMSPVQRDAPTSFLPYILITCDRIVRVWNIETGFKVCCLRGHMRAVRAL
jgi:hypothetical protein